ncbi:MAG: class I SAM-dependent methyltransferase [Proteobacteria bacterium]|nr:class I SAM-dependent methyltransferase [Pseudomonadota bacterium]
MITWEDLESHATENGFIPQELYREHARHFRVCPMQPKEVEDAEAEIWDIYLSTMRKGKKQRNLYSEMFRYEWYEGRKRTGFWGNIEEAVGAYCNHKAPRISVFSAGSGRDLLKVGLAAGVWSSKAPSKIKGTYKEIDPTYFQLQKPDARIIVTEFGEGNYNEMKRTITELRENNLIVPGMVYLSRWNFREKAPVASESQDMVVFSLTGNYAHIDEQPLILQEIARCVKQGGYMISSTLSTAFDFLKARGLVYRLKFFLKTPLGWPVALDFMTWQLQWAKMAGTMNKKGLWATGSAEIWADFLKPASMKKIMIYDSPCNLVPVEVLVAQKEKMDASH